MRERVVLIMFVISASTFAQVKVDVAELTMKIGGMSTETVYYGFAEGDQIIFSFEELKGKSLKEIEITELPSSSKFMDFKSKSITDKKIKVNKTSVYKFSFSNTALSGRICKIKIQRIPISEDLISFNTDWKWKTIYDTTYVPYVEDSIVGYDTTYVPYTKKETVSVDTSFFDKEVKPRVHTLLNSKGDKTYVKFDFPLNQKSDLQTKKVVSWAYYIGTDYKEPVVSNITGGLAKDLIMANPVAGVALGVVSLATSSAGHNIKYYLVRDYQNVQYFMNNQGFRVLDQGDVSMMSNRFVDGLKQGTIYLCFDNDHTYPVDVLVKFSAIVVTKTFEYKELKKQVITNRKVTLNKIKKVIKSTKVRVNAE